MALSRPDHDPKIGLAGMATYVIIRPFVQYANKSDPPKKEPLP
jgi:hypothetical protein